MPSAKLIKALEKRGFALDFPSFRSSEEIVQQILKENNPRIKRSLPLFLQEGIDYRELCSKLNAKEIKELDKAIIISLKIYEKESIESSLKEIIRENKIRSKSSKAEFDDYYDSFKESELNAEKSEGKIIEKQSKLRLNLDLNKSLAVLFSPAKISIMKKIFNHDKLTNTELKYYYKAISSINKAVLNPALQDYLRVIETTRKISEKKQEGKE